MAKTKSASQTKGSGSRSKGSSVSKSGGQGGMTKSGVASAGGSYSKQQGMGFSSRPGKDEKVKPEAKPVAPVITPTPPAGKPISANPVKPRQPDVPKNPAPITPVNPNLPRDTVEASRGERRSLGAQLRDPQGTAQRSAQSYRGQAIAPVRNIYGETIPGFGAPVTNQQFNGPRGSKTVLGR